MLNTLQADKTSEVQHLWRWGFIFALATASVVIALTPSLCLASDATGPQGGGQAFNVIAGLAFKIYDWLKIPAMAIALFVGGYGIFQWLIQGASNPQAHRRGLEIVIGIVVLLFLLLTLDGILRLVVGVGNDVDQYLRDNTTSTIVVPSNTPNAD
jgi:Na+/H+ antiporter NhaC